MNSDLAAELDRRRLCQQAASLEMCCGYVGTSQAGGFKQDVGTGWILVPLHTSTACIYHTSEMCMCA